MVRTHVVAWQDYLPDGSVGPLQRLNFASVEQAATEGAAIFRKPSTFAAWLNGTPFSFTTVGGAIHVVPGK